jgi:hypothetical protein
MIPEWESVDERFEIIPDFIGNIFFRAIKFSRGSVLESLKCITPVMSVLFEHGREKKIDFRPDLLLRWRRFKAFSKPVIQ